MFESKLANICGIRPCPYTTWIYGRIVNWLLHKETVENFNMSMDIQRIQNIQNDINNQRDFGKNQLTDGQLMTGE